MNTSIGIVIGIIHTILLAISLISNKIISSVGFDANVNILFIGVSNSIMGAIYFCIFGDFMKLANFWCSFVCFSNGIIFYVACSLVHNSYSYVDIIKTTSCSYIQIVWSFLVGALVLNDTIGVMDITGACIIVGFNLYHVYYPIEKD